MAAVRTAASRAIADVTFGALRAIADVTFGALRVVLWQNRGVSAVTELLIRPAAATDVEPLAELAAETFPLACPPHTTAEAVADFVARNFLPEHFASHLADPDRIVLVAERSDGTSARLVGYSMLVGGEPGDADAAAAVAARPAIELSKFYTRADEHGGGIAAPLMAATLDAAGATGAIACWLGVNEQNARAIRFYEKHGFAKAGRKHFTVGGRLENDWVLAQPLG
ncbi:GNAT family N-acetyltransferase [Agromyces sp. NPDC127015]|uniref:GNAT family N-acetyltransferase n=1 Tax=Agromyces sp. NPDC127015 TaxID=3347108 RepID=UPI003650ECEA